MPPPDPHTAPLALVPKKISASNGSSSAFSLTYAEFRSLGFLALNVVTRLVPPTAVTCGLDAGEPIPASIGPQIGVGGVALKHATAGISKAPQSPDEETKVMPNIFPSMKKSS